MLLYSFWNTFFILRFEIIISFKILYYNYVKSIKRNWNNITNFPNAPSTLFVLELSILSLCKLKNFFPFDDQTLLSNWNLQKVYVNLFLKQTMIILYLFVCSFSSHSNILLSFGDVTIAVEGLQIFTYARHLWPLSSEGFFFYT